MSRLDPGLNKACADLLKILANPCRLRIFNWLIEDHPLTVSDLQSRAGVEQSLVSYHLKVLRDAGLVVSQREGKCIRYGTSEAVSRTEQGNRVDLGCCSILVPDAPEAAEA